MVLSDPSRFNAESDVAAQVCNQSILRLSQDYNFEASLRHIVRLFSKTETKGGSGWGHKCYHTNSFINRYLIPLLVSKSPIIALDFTWTHCFTFLITPIAGHSLPPAHLTEVWIGEESWTLLTLSIQTFCSAEQGGLPRLRGHGVVTHSRHFSPFSSKQAKCKDIC